MTIITLPQAIHISAKNLNAFGAYVGLRQKAFAEVLGFPYASLRLIAANGEGAEADITARSHSLRPQQKTTLKLLTHPFLPYQVRHGWAIVHYFPQLLARNIFYTPDDFPRWHRPLTFSA